MMLNGGGGGGGRRQQVSKTGPMTVTAVAFVPCEQLHSALRSQNISLDLFVHNDLGLVNDFRDLQRCIPCDSSEIRL